MKQPIKQYFPEPRKTVQKAWYPYYDDEADSLVFKEYCEKDEEDENLTLQDSLTISQIRDCVNVILEKYKGIHPDSISIRSIVLDSREDDTTIEFLFNVKLSDEEFAEQMAEYNRKQNEQKQKFAEWEEFNKAKKIQELKRELEKLEKLK